MIAISPYLEAKFDYGYFIIFFALWFHHQTNLREYFTVYNKIVRKDCRTSPEIIGALRRSPTTTTTTSIVGDHQKEGRDLDGSKEVKKKLKNLEKELAAGSDGSRGPPKARLQEPKWTSRGGKK